MTKTAKQRRMRNRVAARRGEGVDGFASLFRANPMPCLIATGDPGQIIEVNPALVVLIGQPISELIGRTFEELGTRVASEDAHGKEKDRAAAMPGRRHRMRTVDGRELHLRIDVAPVAHHGRSVSLYMIRDVTQHCLSRGALRSSEARLSAIINSVQVMIGETTADGRLIEVNRAALDVAGLARAEVIGLPFDQTGWFADLPLSQARIRDAISRAGAGETVQHDIQYRAAGGQLGQAVFMLVPMRDATGRTISLIASGLDVSARHAAEQALRGSEQRLRMLVDNIAGFVGELSPGGILLDVNRAALLAGGVKREEVIGKPLADTPWFSHSESARVIARSAVDAARRGEIVHCDLEVNMAGGQLMPVDFMLAPVFDEQGRVVSLIPSATDITERKAALRQLQRSSGLLEAALNQARMAPWEFDPDADLFTFDDHFYALQATDALREGGYRMSSATYLRKFCHPDDRADLRRQFLVALKSGPTDRASTLAYRVIRRDGEVRHVASRFDIVRDANGRSQHLHGANQDVTEQIVAAQQMRAQRDVQSMLSLAAAGLLAAPTTQIDGAIDAALSRCAKWLGADHAYMFVYSDDGLEMRNSHEWCADGVAPRIDQMQHVSQEIIPWLRQQLAAVGLVVVADVAGLPAEAALEQRHLDAFQVRSLFAIPLHARGQVSGFIGFHAIRRPRDWNIADGALLKVLGEIVGSALNRQRAEQSLRLLAENTASAGPDAFYAASVEALAHAMGATVAMIAVCNSDDPTLATTLAFWDSGRLGDNFTYSLLESPCEQVHNNAMCQYREKVCERFPNDRWLVDRGIESYVGVQLLDEHGTVLGHIAVLDVKPMPDDAEVLTYVTLYADRIATEMTRRRADDALRLSEAGLRATLDSTCDGILAVDNQGRIRFANQRVAEMWGLPEHLMASSPRDAELLALAAEQVQDPQAYIERVRELYQSDEESEDLLRLADGRVFERYSKALVEDGAVVGRVWSFHDTTASKQLETALHQNQDQLDQAMDAANMAAWDYDAANATFHWNDRFYALFGTSAELEGGYQMAASRYVEQLCHPEDAGIVAQAIADVATEQDTSRSYSASYRIIRRDNGAVRDVVANYHLVQDPAGSTIRAWGALQDVTELRHAERELARLNSELERRVEERSAALHEQQAAAQVMLENLAEGVVACDAKGELTLFNKTAREWYGCDPREQSAHEWAGRFEIFDASGAAALAPERHPLTRARGGELVRDFEMQIRRKGGDARQVLVNGGPIFDAEGESLGAIVAMHDISGRTRQAEDRMAREHAERASLAKSGFLAAMSHEIRTPMNAVLGLVEVLGYGDLAPHQADLVATIRQSAAQLLRLIDDILDFSKIEAGRLELEKSAFAPARLVEGVVKTLATTAAQKKVALRLFIDPGIASSLLGDETALRQVIYNLFGNAIKFSSGRADRPGRVELRLEPDLAATDQLRLTISDNGIGMGPEVIDKLFTAFTQGEGSTTRRFGGTGLGLAICRRVVGLMGGSIEVSSVVGVGSTFTVRFPVVRDPGSIEPRGLNLAGVNCILVQGKDVYDAADLQLYLEAAGASVQGAVAGEIDALVLRGAALGSVAAKALVLIHPPGSAPKHPVGFSRLVVGGGRRRRARRLDEQTVSLDADALCFGELVRAVEIASGRADSSDVHALPHQRMLLAGSDGAAMRLAGHSILVAEDDPVNQLVISHQLQLLGYIAEIAGDGVDALRLWRSGHHALLLVDLHMPQLDGYELTRAIRAEEQARGRENGCDPSRIPILALTANALRGEEHQAFEVGMDGYLTKPISLEELNRNLLQWLPAPAATGGRMPAPAAAPSDESDRDMALIDLKVPSRLVGDDVQLLHELLGDYIDASQNMADALHRAAASADCERARSIAHNFKSSARTVGALSLGAVCAELEDAGQAGDAAAVAESVARLLPMHRQVIEAITKFVSNASLS